LKPSISVLARPFGRHIVPPDKRAAVLALATANEDAEARERKENAGRLRFMKFDEINVDAPCHRYWNRIMRLKAAVVYTFTTRHNERPQRAGRRAHPIQAATRS
jgi:hypothetical protein